MESSSELELSESYGYISADELNLFDEKIVLIAKQLAKLRSTLQAE